jgi:N12 class adenine-specific DNA methylase
MKATYLHEQHAGHGVTFATGTPISNTMVEMYTLCARAHKVYYVA